MQNRSLMLGKPGQKKGSLQTVNASRTKRGRNRDGVHQLVMNIALPYAVQGDQRARASRSIQLSHCVPSIWSWEITDGEKIARLPQGRQASSGSVVLRRTLP